jgi:parvulin-like peptidyl-prolyl isomerase
MSVDASKAEGGDVGWTPRGALPPEVEAFAFSRTGQSDIIETKRGYYIVDARGHEVRPVTDDTKASISSFQYEAALQSTRLEVGSHRLLTNGHVSRLTRELVQNVG